MKMVRMNASSLYPEIHLETIRRTDDGRNVTYSTAGPAGAPCVLFFYPGGGNRRMLLSLQGSMPHLRLICVNRPGKGDTSPALKGHIHITTVLQDAIFVLDTLGVDRVSLLCMCAGTPFAMAFATQHPERTTGQFMGISSWVLPADCGYANTTTLNYLGTRVPSASALAGSVMSSVLFSMTTVPPSWLMSVFRRKVSDEERDAFDAKYHDKKDFSKQMKWIFQERGGQGEDLAVLLHAGTMVDYQKIGQTQTVILWHGTRDTLVPYVSAQWLADQIPGANLHSIAYGTHDGVNFLLHSSVVDSLKSFGIERELERESDKNSADVLSPFTVRENIAVV